MSPGIYAAGDVAIGPDILAGRTASDTSASAHAIQPTAVDHGRIAGANMAGHETHYPGSLLLNVLDVVNLHCASFGLWRDEGHDTTTVFNASRPIYRKYVWHEDRIVGALFVGPIDDVTMLNDVGMVKGLIQTQQPLGDWAAYIKANPTDVRRRLCGQRSRPGADRTDAVRRAGPRPGLSGGRQNAASLG